MVSMHGTEEISQRLHGRFASVLGAGAGGVSPQGLAEVAFMPVAYAGAFVVIKQKSLLPNQ